MKKLTFRRNNELIDCEIDAKIDKSVLYGTATKETVIGDEVLSKALLTPEGMVLTQKEIGSTKVDQNGSYIGEVKAQRSGKTIELIPSSFANPREIKEVKPEDLLDFIEKSTYPIKNISLPCGTYASDFSYRDGYSTAPAILDIRNDGTGFLRVGVKTEPVFVGQADYTSIFETETVEESDGDSIDFGF